MTEIYLGFASSRLHMKDGEMHYDMSPGLGTQMMLPFRGAISSVRVLRNTREELVLAKGLARYAFLFSPRKTGPDSLRLSVSLFGFLPLGRYWGDISTEGRKALQAAFGGQVK